MGEAGVLRARVPEPSTVCLSGDFDFDDVATFEAALGEVAAAPAALTIDVRELTFIGSTGVRALLEARRERGLVILRGVSPRLRQVLDVAGARELFQLR